MIRARRAAAILLAAAATLALASCAPEPQAGQGTSTPAPSAEPSGPGAEPTCETILPESLVAEFTEYGLRAVEEPFSFGDPATTSLPEGLMCTWGNPELATDHGVQMFGWAPLDPAGRDKWSAFLQEQGWIRSEGGDLLYFSDPFEGVDGVTYAFADGYVVLADTKEGVTLVSVR
jgi:hypothetical protein